MKSLYMTAAAVVALAFAAPAMAQDAGPTVYGTLGYANVNSDDVNLGAIQGRVGARFSPHFGIEGEVAGGVVGDDVTVLGTKVDVDLNYEVGAFVVGYLPLGPNADLFARVGYASSEIEASAGGFSASGSEDGFAYGIGGQYFFTDKDGVRVDYTRHDYGDADADVFGVSYIRKF